MKARHISGLLLAGMLAACGGQEAPPPEEATGDRVLLESARAPLERAHAVEDIAAGRREELDAAVEAAGDQ
ncbi:MAG: hypothetical protein IT486_10615 [Gammaproteobacteria bacterium]|nr:hypothetical protein [Gammaproteobacteria bacterium]